LTEITTHLTKQLKRTGIRPSFQRLKVLEYLWTCQTHPTVEEIFTALTAEIPTLSKATIYNTLHTFIQAGLVREITIDADAQHYDLMLADHGHFKCLSCGKIFNFDLNFDQLVVDGLQAFLIKKKDVYFSGLCPDCQSKSNSE
jgi:Fur family transcriptional regulator, peroxide stress response regulator